MLSSCKQILKQCLKAHKNILTYAALVVFLVFWYTFFGCPLKWATGIPCAGCGMTRAVLALLRGDLRSALYFHPLVFVLPVIACVYLCRKHISQKAQYILVALMLSLFTAVYFYRLLSGSETVSIHLDEGAIFRLCKLIFK